MLYVALQIRRRKYDCRSRLNDGLPCRECVTAYDAHGPQAPATFCGMTGDAPS